MMKIEGSKMQSVEDLVENIDDMVREYVEDNALTATPEQLGLDSRCYTTLYYTSEFIAVSGSTRNLDYYGGFEYVDAEDRKQAGSYTFYLSSCKRVREHLYRVLEKDEARRLHGEWGDDRDESED